MCGRLWTSSEEELATELSLRHVNDIVFKRTLGRTKNSWTMHLVMLRRKANIPPRKYCYSKVHFVSARPSIELLQDADARIVAPYRSQMGAFCGDPPFGYSALDKRI